MKRFIPALALAALLLCLMTNRARADLTINLDDVTIPVGQTSAAMNLFISSNTGDTLSSFGFTLQITSFPSTDLTFSSGTQPDPWNNTSPYPLPTSSTTLADFYVFAGNSGFQDGNQPFWGPLGTEVNYAGDNITTVGDLTDAPAGSVTLTAGTQYYLATVLFTAVANPASFEQFQVSLVPSSYNSGSPPGPLSYFDDANGNPLNYTTTGGMVSMGPGVASVPEPASLLTGFAGAVAFMSYGWMRRRRARRRPA